MAIWKVKTVIPLDFSFNSFRLDDFNRSACWDGDCCLHPGEEGEEGEINYL
jgi:hypothetical protein